MFTLVIGLVSSKNINDFLPLLIQDTILLAQILFLKIHEIATKNPRKYNFRTCLCLCSLVDGLMSTERATHLQQRWAPHVESTKGCQDHKNNNHYFSYKI